MPLHNLYQWSHKENALASACAAGCSGSCGSDDKKTPEAPSACSAGDPKDSKEPSACAASCGATDK